MDRGGVLCLVLAKAAVAVGYIGVNGISYAVEVSEAVSNQPG